MCGCTTPLLSMSAAKAALSTVSSFISRTKFPGFSLFSHRYASLASDVWRGVTVSVLCVLYYTPQTLFNTGLCIVPRVNFILELAHFQKGRLYKTRKYTDFTEFVSLREALCEIFLSSSHIFFPICISKINEYLCR